VKNDQEPLFLSGPDKLSVEWKDKFSEQIRRDSHAYIGFVDNHTRDCSFVQTMNLSYLPPLDHVKETFDPLGSIVDVVTDLLHTSQIAGLIPYSTDHMHEKGPAAHGSDHLRKDFHTHLCRIGAILQEIQILFIFDGVLQDQLCIYLPAMARSQPALGSDGGAQDIRIAWPTAYHFFICLPIYQCFSWPAKQPCWPIHDFPFKLRIAPDDRIQPQLLLEPNQGPQGILHKAVKQRARPQPPSQKSQAQGGNDRYTIRPFASKSGVYSLVIGQRIESAASRFQH